MMFLIHAAFALGLLSLAAGAALYIFASRHTGAGTSLGRVVGFIVMVVSTLSLLCSFYLGVMIWKEIYYVNMAQMHNAQMQNASMTKEMNGANTTKAHTHKK